MIVDIYHVVFIFHTIFNRFLLITTEVLQEIFQLHFRNRKYFVCFGIYMVHSFLYYDEVYSILAKISFTDIVNISQIEN